MTNTSGTLSCSQGCWLIAAGAGVLAAVLLPVLGGWMVIQALFVAIIVFVALGLLLGWLVCRPLPSLADSPEHAPAAPAPAPGGAAAPAPPAATADAAPRSAVQPSAPLAGQDELAARKGDWKYDGGAAPASTDDANAGDGRPARLDAARDGGADDLKLIKGVGPKLEELLHSMGFYHFDQIAGWTEREVEWVDENLEGFKGRVSRDEWVEQAKILAAGGDTEFSKRNS